MAGASEPALEWALSEIEKHGAFHVAAIARSRREALSFLRVLKPDLLVIEAQMPVFDLTAAADELPPVVVLLDPEADSEGATQGGAAAGHAKVFGSAYAIGTAACIVDRVPVKAAEKCFSQALDRAIDAVRRREFVLLSRRLMALLQKMEAAPAPSSTGEMPAQTSASAEESATKSESERLAVRERGGWTFVDVREVDWIEGAHVYCKIHAGGRMLLRRGTLREMEGTLPPSFCRVHRSTIINTARVRSVRALTHGDYEVTLTDGTALKVSRNYRDRLRGLLKVGAAGLVQP